MQRVVHWERKAWFLWSPELKSRCEIRRKSRDEYQSRRGLHEWTFGLYPVVLLAVCVLDFALGSVILEDEQRVPFELNFDILKISMESNLRRVKFGYMTDSKLISSIFLRASKSVHTIQHNPL